LSCCCQLPPARPILWQRAFRPAPARLAQRPHPGETVLDFLVTQVLMHRHHLAAIRATVLDFHMVSSPLALLSKAVCCLKHHPPCPSHSDLEGARDSGDAELELCRRSWAPRACVAEAEPSLLGVVWASAIPMADQHEQSKTGVVRTWIRALPAYKAPPLTLKMSKIAGEGRIQH